VASEFDDAAFFEDADPIGLAHGGEAVGDDEASAVGSEVFKRVLHEAFGAVVECGGCFVEQ
jgi:hypothetical protein